MADPTCTYHILLGEETAHGTFSVSLESFLLFDNAMTHGLDQLERRFANWATPNSLRRDIWENLDR